MRNYLSKYPLLNDKSWLQEQYVNNGLSTISIAKLAGSFCCNSVRRSLIRHNIPVRNSREGQIYNRKRDFILNESVVIGCLLGDGYMKKHRKESKICAPYFAKTNKHLDHVQYVAGFLFNNPEKFVTSTTNLYKGRIFPRHILRSYTDECLIPIYEKWYPESNNYQKIVPLDIELNETILLHWFMDDGSSYCRSGRERRSKQIIISLASESFTKEEQEFLSQQMFEKWGLLVNIGKCKSGTGWRMYFRQSQAELFFSIIGLPPVPSLAYKWK